jgi:probable phosphoglycerate mutase
MDEVGLAQVSAAADVLAELFPEAVLVASDLARAWNTALEYGRRVATQPLPDPRLRERSFGAWEGLQRDEIATQWPEIYAAWRAGLDPATKPPGGETRAEVGRRVAAAVREHAAALASDQVLLVVSHGAAITAALSDLLGEDPGTWYAISGIENANWSILVPTAYAAGWRLAGHNLGLTAHRLHDIFGT